jgi:hypothetical protein
MYYSYGEIEYVATSFSPARTDLAVKLLRVEGERVQAYLHKSEDSLPVKSNYVVKNAAFEETLRGQSDFQHQ